MLTNYTVQVDVQISGVQLNTNLNVFFERLTVQKAEWFGVLVQFSNVRSGPGLNGLTLETPLPRILATATQSRMELIRPATRGKRIDMSSHLLLLVFNSNQASSRLFPSTAHSATMQPH
jgi:hypothetical protein